MTGKTTKAKTQSKGPVQRRAGTIGRAIQLETFADSPYTGVSPKVLQRQLGNKGTQAWLSELAPAQNIRAKLTIGQPNDKYEQEADRVAEQVMRMPDQLVQRKCQECEEGLQKRPLNKEGKEELIQVGKTGSDIPETTPEMSFRIQSLQGGGRPLSRSERSFFEPRFGADFSDVRVHDNSNAAELARSVNARAFTLGSNVVLGAGEYSPEASSGKHLLAHELTHVVQQNGGLSLLSPGNSFKDAMHISQKTEDESLKLAQLQFQTSVRPRLQRTAIAVQNGPGVTPIDTDNYLGMQIDVHFISENIYGWSYASRVNYKEEVSEPTELTGSFEQHPPPELSQDQYFSLRPEPDRHAIPKNFLLDHVRDYGAGCFTLYQLDRFRDRLGSTPYVIPYSGYKIEHCVNGRSLELADPDVDLDDVVFTVHKSPVGCTVRSYSAEAGQNVDQELNPEYSVTVPVMRTIDSASTEPGRGDVSIQRYASTGPYQSFGDDRRCKEKLSQQCIQAKSTSNQSIEPAPQRPKLKNNMRSIQRLSITPNQPIETRKCGFRRSIWTFELDNPAPIDGYFVQQVNQRDARKQCPCQGGKYLIEHRKNYSYWEAWYVPKGSRRHQPFKSPRWGSTDQSTEPGKVGHCGESYSHGTLKFYPVSITGDLGRYRPVQTQEGSPKGSGWTTKSKYGGGLPTTTEPPLWWGESPMEGPVTRWAASSWRCCGDENDYDEAEQNP